MSKNNNEIMKSRVTRTRQALGYFITWTILALLIGGAVGVAGFAFDKALEIAAELRGEHNWFLFLLPVAGLAIVGLYELWGVNEPKGTNRILLAAERGDHVGLRVAPMIFIATFLTHITGGSAGREGAALQLGGSMANYIGRFTAKLRLKQPDLRIVTMSGMAAGFSALFGAPLASAVFALEVTNNVIQYAALYPCMLSSVVAKYVSGLLGGKPVCFELTQVPAFSGPVIAKVIFLALLTSLLAILFVWVMEQSGHLNKKIFKNRYVRVLVGAALVIGLSLLEGSGDYNGAGMNIISRAVAGEAVWYAFLFKLLLTAITLGAGFKGGEIVPTLFVGSTFGCVVSGLVGLPAPFCAALCMMALFCGVTNCPIAAIFLAFELFGSEGLVLYGLACAISYLLSGQFSLYTAQTLRFSKLEYKE